MKLITVKKLASGELPSTSWGVTDKVALMGQYEIRLQEVVAAFEVDDDA